ncbi:MAG: hypothetical protein ACI8ZN_001856, partial [Bacteroidia bacterium]
MCCLLSSSKPDQPNLFQSWYSSKVNVCLTINPKGYSSVNEEDQVKYKVKNNKLKLIFFYNPKALIGGK